MFKRITSRHNPLIKEIRRISQGKVSNRFIIDTVKPLEIAHQSERFMLEKIVVTERFINNNPQLLRVFKDKGVEVIVVNEEVINIISDAKVSQGVVGIVNFTDWTKQDIDLDALSTVVICDAISDPGNLGSIIRSCDAFSVKGVFVVNDTCNIYSPKVVRASAGSLMNLPVVVTDIEGLRDFLIKNNFKTYAADAHNGKDLLNTTFVGKIAIIFGNEAHGLSKNIIPLIDFYVTIPLHGKAESLNVAAANAVILYEVMRQRKGG
ncbi:MAG: RNA methyltransferase [Thermodesulfovibrionales bacterium]|nr:RNA methyltransferase [Thermodesulfovibrionales bacterium]